jgi:hypothetical protein
MFTPLGSENVLPTGREPEGVVGGVVPLRFRGDSEDFHPSVRGAEPL